MIHALHTLDSKFRRDADPVAVQYRLERQRPLLPGVFFCPLVVYNGLQLTLMLKLTLPAAPRREGILSSLGFDSR